VVNQISTYSNKKRVRDKAEFVNADDPANSLLEFFGNFADEIHSCEQPDFGVKSLPLILISQLPRSGGTLLSQLLDGHPALHVYPWEMKIGYPSKGCWPALELDASPDRLFATLFHAELAYLARKGYRKRGKTRQRQKRLNFDYSPIEHYRSFVHSLPRERSRRTVLDTYFNTFFHAWHHRTEKAAYIAGFVPTMAKNLDSIADFFSDYPDGGLVSILRDPADWFVSRRAHTKRGLPRYDDIGQEMLTWNGMAKLAVEYRRIYGDQFLLLSFKDLVTDREGTMRRVCNWCGLDFLPCLLTQTFAGNIVPPNTNFEDPIEELAGRVLDRKHLLTERERTQIYASTRRLRAELHELGCAT
jgi:hypothetical protein